VKYVQIFMLLKSVPYFSAVQFSPDAEQPLHKRGNCILL